MEDILEVYHRPLDPDCPVVCMDESNKQLIGEVKQPIPCSKNHPVLVDDEYVRNGVADIFMAVEPLSGKRYTEITETRTRLDWARFMKKILDEKYPDANRVCLVMDNLNTHGNASFYSAFPPDEALRLSKKLEIHFTPVHGSWLNCAEIELSALKGQCLSRRIADIEYMRSEVLAWENSRNNKDAKINWQFTTEKARVKLKRLYPSI
jgi:hypothetical protein